MAGDQQPIASNEYGNKLLNGEGLLHLVGTIKTEISNAGGGGATYTAGDGIEIDENNKISNIRPFDLSSYFANLFQAGTGAPTWGKTSPARTTIEDIANDLLKNGVSIVDGYSLFSGVSPAAINAVNNTNWAFKAWIKNDSTYAWSNNYYPSSSTSNLAQWRKQGVFILDGVQVSFYESITTLRYAMMDNIYNSIWVKAGTNFSSSRLPGAIAALDTAISAKQDVLTAGTGIDITNGVISATNSGGGSSLPADPANDGTYFLTTTISSGTATQAWTSIPNANGNNF